MIRYPLIISIVIALITCISAETFAQVKEIENRLNRDPGNVELLKQLVKYYHRIGGDEENETAVTKAEKYLKRWLKLEPDNGAAMVYYGSVMTMKARDTLIPWKKWEYMQDGFAMIDKGIRKSPEDTEARLLRAIHSVSVPGFFGRLDTALEDFKYLKQFAEDENSGLSDEFLLPYYFYYGTALIKDEKSNEARTAFLKVIEISPESDYAETAKKELENIEKK
ncbi:hypothetical protein ACFL6G_10280 [candidate division KSB1 bacterium]